jgi:glycosyltransferase involved in cell wall biosynthesis
MTKISCALIVRDDEATLENCLQSIRAHVDELVIVDTGSVDSSPAIAKRYADHWELFTDCNDEHGRIADFAAARNRSFELCTHPWVCWFDGDDVVTGGEHLRRMAESVTEDTARILLPYEYSHDSSGRVDCLQYRERLMRSRHRFRWVSPVHEICQAIEPIEGTFADHVREECRVVHRKHLSRKAPDPDRNIRILRRHVAAVGEADPRAMYYLGVEFSARGDMGQALKYYRRYVELSDWDDEKYKALMGIAEHYARVGDYPSAIEWATKAMLTRSWPEAYYLLGRCFYMQAFELERETDGPTNERMLRRAAHFIQTGMRFATDPILYANPLERYRMNEYLNVCLGRLGDIDGAIKSCEEGLEALPENESLRVNLERYKAERGKRALTSTIAELVESKNLTDGQAALMRAALSGDLRIETESPEAIYEQHLFSMLPGTGKLNIALYVGHGVEPWNGKTFAKTGLGGSETMAWEMAKRLVKLGHAVTIYGHCTPSMQGLCDGVLFLDATAFRNVTCDLLISSRQPSVVDAEHGCKAGARILWVHDVHCGEALTREREARFDRILCLSNWHKEFFLRCYSPGGTSIIDPDKVIVTRNGIDLSRFEGSEPRNPHRAIYSSSPDRGLLTALECWPRIREQVPDAELHVFYGFGNWEPMARHMAAMGAPEGEQELKTIAHLKALLKSTPGVVFRDRVSQSELAREFMRAGVWAYPTWFSETSCITAMEAQAAGLDIVTSPIAALNETVGKFGVMIEGDWRSSEYASKFAAAVVASMQVSDTDGDGGRAFEGVEERFGLDALAADWDTMLLKIHADVTERVVPAFREAAE